MIERWNVETRSLRQRVTLQKKTEQVADSRGHPERLWGTDGTATPDAAAATRSALATCTYANGTAGVGATLTANANGALAAIDGVSLAVNDYLVVKDQAAALQNGLYRVTQLGSASTPWILTRATTMDAASEYVAKTTEVLGGTVYEDTQWTCTNTTAPTVGTTSIAWQQTEWRNIAAKVYTPSGRKLELVKQLVSSATHIVELRYRPVLVEAAAEKNFRVVYNGRTFNIGFINDLEERHVKLELLCTEEKNA